MHWKSTLTLAYKVVLYCFKGDKLWVDSNANNNQNLNIKWKNVFHSPHRNINAYWIDVLYISLNLFLFNSPSGKLVQIEYALAAVAAGAPSVGIKGKRKLLSVYIYCLISCLHRQNSQNSLVQLHQSNTFVSVLMWQYSVCWHLSTFHFTCENMMMKTFS